MRKVGVAFVVIQGPVSVADLVSGTRNRGSKEAGQVTTSYEPSRSDTPSPVF